MYITACMNHPCNYIWIVWESHSVETSCLQTISKIQDSTLQERLTVAARCTNSFRAGEAMILIDRLTLQSDAKGVRAATEHLRT